VTGRPPSDFADLLRRLRRDARLTQEELAEDAAVSLRTIQDLEGRRHRTAHKPTAERLAGALNLTGPARALFVKAAAGRAAAAEVLAAAGTDDAAAITAAAGPGPQAAAPVPRELPADVSAFTGRAGELAELDALLPAAPEPGGTPHAVVISAISGTAGAGKTALAVHWAHRVAGHFPDGQLYVNLRGFDPEQPVTAEEALAGLLAALGAGAIIPPGEAARAARYRSLLAGRRLLIVLDNAASAEHVRPLLPGSASALVLVTSRTALPGLVARDGAHRLDLDLLPAEDAVALLRTLIGERVDADPAATLALAGLCARLPLALRVAAELAVARPGMPLDALAAELAGERDRLDLLDAGGDSRSAVASVLSWSYRHLPGDAARLFRLLGLHPGQDWDAHAAAALSGSTVPQAGQFLGVLARSHLIQPAGAGRHGMHDLLRAYATRQAASLDDDQTRHDALARLYGYYLAACAAAMDSLALAEQHHRPDPPPTGTPVPHFDDPDAASSWLDAELATIVAIAGQAASHGWPQYAIGLAQTLHRYFDGVHDAAGMTICQHALDAARHSGDLGAQARTLTTLGVIYGRQGRYAEAAECQQQAIGLARGAGDRLTEGWALGNLALIHDQQGRYPQAARCHRQALALCRELGDVTGEAIALSNLGLVYLRQGRYQRAASHMRQALGLYRQVGHRFGEVIALTNLGDVCYRQGDYERAAGYQEQALALSRELGSRRVEAWALARLGAVSSRRGRYDQAVSSYQQALELFQEAADRDGEAEALNGSGENMLAVGQHDKARRFHLNALTLTRQTGGKREQARALTGLGAICYRQGQLDRAAGFHQDALALYREIGDPGGQTAALNGSGEVLLATGQPGEALSRHQAALTLAGQTGDRFEQARAHHGLANACHAAGQHEAGRTHWEQALAGYTSLGVPEADDLRTVAELPALPE
jgi:tetratricopeptide (TPR) repeat protein/transcriptional regulator with XRE-family HTH domain